MVAVVRDAHTMKHTTWVATLGQCTPLAPPLSSCLCPSPLYIRMVGALIAFRVHYETEVFTVSSTAHSESMVQDGLLFALVRPTDTVWGLRC